MAEMILPGVYIEVRPEGLIAPGQITVGNVGVVGTASKGPIGVPTLLGSYADAQRTFGTYDPFLDPVSGVPDPGALTLVRALELIFNFGASTVYAVRVSTMDTTQTPPVPKAVRAVLVLKDTTPASCVILTADTEGEWGNALTVDVASPAAGDAFIEDEGVPTSGADALKLLRSAKNSPRNRVSLIRGGVTTLLNVVTSAPVAGGNQVQITATALVFAGGEAPAATDQLIASYAVDKSKAADVTLHLSRSQELYTVADGNQLADLINSQSAWATATADLTNGKKLPAPIPAATPAQFGKGIGNITGTNGADVTDNSGDWVPSADYQGGLNALLNQDVQIVVGAGQDFKHFGNKLDLHCQKASTDVVKRDRIGVVGTPLAEPKRAQGVTPSPDKQETFFQNLLGHPLDSDRVILVAPGCMAVDTAESPAGDVELPGTYTAAAFAGLLSSLPPHISPTNKILAVDDLEIYWDDPHLTQLVQNRVCAIESREGFHVVKGVTTTTDGAFAQITTRRIVDYAKAGVRSAANPYIGLLNNERVRDAMRATINSFLARMVDDEMLEGYDLTVSATRADEIAGIANVEMTLQPTFSIDFIKVTMVLE
jgi:hypothetical protein